MSDEIKPNDQFVKWRERRSRERSASLAASLAQSAEREANTSAGVGAASEDRPTSSSIGSSDNENVPTNPTQPMRHLECSCPNRDGICSEYVHISELNDFLNFLNLERSNEETMLKENQSCRVPRSFNLALGKYIGHTIPSDKAAGNDTLRKEGKMRRIMLYNPGPLLDYPTKRGAEPFIQPLIKGIIKDVAPDVALLNELWLRYKILSEEKTLILLNKLFGELDPPYVVKNILPSYRLRENRKPGGNSPSYVRGSLILVRKSIEDEFEVGVVHLGKIGESKDRSFELVSVLDRKLRLPIYCSYVQNDQEEKSHANAAEALKEYVPGLGGGDFNLKPFSKFDDYFPYLNECTNKDPTHQKKGKKKPEITFEKIDYVFLHKDVKHVMIIKHDLLMSDPGVNEAHYPHVFDAVLIEDESSECKSGPSGNDDVQKAVVEVEHGCANKQDGMIKDGQKEENVGDQGKKKSKKSGEKGNEEKGGANCKKK